MDNAREENPQPQGDEAYSTSCWEMTPWVKPANEILKDSEKKNNNKQEEEENRKWKKKIQVSTKSNSEVKFISNRNKKLVKFLVG